MSLQRTDVGGYLFDPDSNVVINTNDSELRSYRAQVAAAVQVSEMRSQYDLVLEELAALRRELDQRRK